MPRRSTTPRCSNRMAHPPPTNSLPSSLHSPTLKPHPNQTSSTSSKIKTLVQAYIYPQVSHVVRALAYAKTLLIDLFNSKDDDGSYNVKLRRRRRKKKKEMFRVIRMCSCTRSSSHVLPMPEPSCAESHAYYDSSWNSMIPNEQHEGNDDMDPGVLSGYLQWLEEKENDGGLMVEDGASEIDRLAERFIASCHEKFRLEKQESYRMYQEMLARSL